MKKLNTLFLILTACLLCQAMPGPKSEYYEIKIYQIANADQEKQVDDFLKNAYLPALHRAGIRKVGVFKPVEGDSAYVGKRIYVFTPFTSLAQWHSLHDGLAKDKLYLEAGKNYLDAPFNNPPYARMESILLRAFKDMPQLEVPKLNSKPQDRIYELRSYEGHTEKIYQNKVKMFNEGGEIPLFKRLGFNAVFYGEVLAGSSMPNLMYMTSFENQASRDEHWKKFVDDSEWKKLSKMPEYQNNVSKNTVYLLHSTSYSDI